MKIIKLGSININDYNVKTGPKNSAMNEVCAYLDFGDGEVCPLQGCRKWGFINGCKCF